MVLPLVAGGKNAGVGPERLLEAEARYRDDKKERNQIFVLAYSKPPRDPPQRPPSPLVQTLISPTKNWVIKVSLL